MGEPRRGEISYLLRVWHAGPDVWRASLQSPHSRERMGFPSMEAAFDFLRQQAGIASVSHDVQDDADGPCERRGG